MNDEISHKDESLKNMSKLGLIHKIWGIYCDHWISTSSWYIKKNLNRFLVFIPT